MGRTTQEGANMSEEALRALLDRINTDESFREQVAADPGAALIDQAELSQVEKYALVLNDEDGLRHLLGEDTSGFARSALPNPFAIVVPSKPKPTSPANPGCYDACHTATWIEAMR
jgi:hypothetical protein